MPKASDYYKKRPFVDLSDNKPHILTIIDNQPKDALTRLGMRKVLNVVENGEEKSLWLSTVGLRIIFNNLIEKYEDLSGKTIKITRLPKKVGRLYDYEFEEV